MSTDCLITVNGGTTNHNNESSTCRLNKAVVGKVLIIASAITTLGVGIATNNPNLSNLGLVLTVPAVYVLPSVLRAARDFFAPRQTTIV